MGTESISENRKRELSKEEGLVWKWLPDSTNWQVDTIKHGMLLTFYNPTKRSAIIIYKEQKSVSEIERLEGYLITRRIRVLVLTYLDIQCEPHRVSGKVKTYCKEPNLLFNL